jgi:hypothetical protein
MLEIVMHTVLSLKHSTSPTNVKKMGIKANNNALSQDYSPLYNYYAGFANPAMNERPSLNGWMDGPWTGLLTVLQKVHYYILCDINSSNHRTLQFLLFI